MTGPVTELLSDPKRWCKGWPARDSQGGGCKLESSKAVAWSLLGAMRLYYGDKFHSVRRRIDRWVEQHGYINAGGYVVPLGIWASAPDRTHGEVIQMCRELGI